MRDRAIHPLATDEGPATSAQDARRYPVDIHKGSTETDYSKWFYADAKSLTACYFDPDTDRTTTIVIPMRGLVAALKRRGLVK